MCDCYLKRWHFPPYFISFQCLKKTLNQEDPMAKKKAHYLSYASLVTYVLVLGKSNVKPPTKKEG